MATESTERADIANHDIKGMSFETAVSELESIVRKLEAGQGELESAIADYQRGSALKEHCIEKLKAAQLKLDKIVRQPDGNLSAQPQALAE